MCGDRCSRSYLLAADYSDMNELASALRAFGTALGKLEDGLRLRTSERMDLTEQN